MSDATLLAEINGSTNQIKIVNAGLQIGSQVGGFRMARGQKSTASASDTVVTGLSNVVIAIANLESAPVIGCMWATAAIGDQAGTPAAGSILIKTWMPTSNSDPTPLAATTFTKVVSWLAIGS